MHKFNKIVINFFLFISIFNNSYSQSFWRAICDLDSVGGVISLNFDHQGVLYAGSTSGLFFSTNSGQNWDKIDGYDFSKGTVTEILFFNDNCFIGTNKKGVFKTTDSGRNWSYSGLKNIWIHDLINDKDGNIYAGTSDKVYKSTDSGTTWFKVGNGFYQYLNGVWSLYSTADGILLAGTECGLYLSENQGNEWAFIESFNCGDINTFGGINNDSLILIGGVDRFHNIYYSSDQGYSWNYLENSDTIYWTKSIIPTSNNDAFIVAGTSGIFKYKVIQQTFISLNEGLPSVSYSNRLRYSARSMALDSLGYLYVTSDKLYKSLKPVDSLKYFTNMKYNYSLMQNYPNPFNSITRINYSLRNEENVTLRVFNTNGERVFQFKKGVQAKGNYSIIVNADRLSSGVYYYQLIAGSFIETKKMLLIK